MNVTRTLLCTLPLLLASTASAQVTGVCGVNDLTISGFGSGSTSCTPTPPMGGAPVTLTATAGPTAFMTIFVIDFCPCVPCTVALPPALVCVKPIPFSACGGTTNQSLDIPLFTCPVAPPLLFAVPNVPGGPPCADGTAPATSATLPLGPIPAGLPAGFVASTQALILDPVCSTIFFGNHALLTQAYDIIK